MRDRDCMEFLQWALPRLRLRWPGFRKVRKQVCKRIHRRIAALGLDGVAGYVARLESWPQEWVALDRMCRVTISRFWRDRRVFEVLAARILPDLAAAATGGGQEDLRCWSAGCASGEEPYSLALAWRLAPAGSFPGPILRIVGTDTDDHLLERARRAVYPVASLRNLPPEWRGAAFDRKGRSFVLRPHFREGVEFLPGDLRTGSPPGRFHLIMCRNLAFTYFQADLQGEVLARLRESLVPGGVLVVGAHETPPDGGPAFAPVPDAACCFLRPT